MQRRQFLQVAAGVFSGGSVLGLLIPMPVHSSIDLASFCADFPYRRYCLDRPFAQAEPSGQEHVYATDGTACVRVAKGAPERTESGRVPDAAGLPFWQAGIGPWQPWPGRKYGPLKSGSLCPQCRGRGRVGPGVIECDHSKATYDPWGGDMECPQCNGTEFCGGLACDACHATGITTTHAIQVVGHQRVMSWQDARIRTLPNVEFRHCVTQELDFIEDQPGNGPILFRFAGGEGLVMPVRRQAK